MSKRNPIAVIKPKEVAYWEGIIRQLEAENQNHKTNLLFNESNLAIAKVKLEDEEKKN